MNDLNMNAPGMSEALYVTLCHKIGFPTQVAIRRDMVDLKETINLLNSFKCKGMSLTSGSKGEGFRFAWSDTDFMHWPTDHKVIWDYNQSDFYRSSDTTLIIMECCDERPGFSLLQLLTPSRNMNIGSACTRMNDGLYISSSLYKQNFLYFKGHFLHGPCVSGCFGGVYEYDIASSFSCDFWPAVASSFIERSQIKGWPSSRVLENIVNGGCHVVPIGRKHSPQEHNEWRISFSVAEQKLVYAMNHCQFLCYGMLKIFLKEVINSNWEEPLLCSYFLKTILFWEIQEINIWAPQNILSCIWQCFKHLIKLVEREECPNFFIPANNMFYGKVVGASRRRLLSQLYDLYSVGMSCILHCPSVWSIIEALVERNSPPKGNIDENVWLSTAEVDGELFNEMISVKRHSGGNLLECYNSLSVLEIIQQKPLSDYQCLALQSCISTALVSTAFHLHDLHNSVHHTNRVQYYADQKVCHMLLYTGKYGNISDILYIAMYYFMTFRYKQALYYVELTKYKLSRLYIMYITKVDKRRYNEAMEGMSSATRMREAYTSDVTLCSKYPYLRELTLEIKAIESKKGITLLHIPPHAMVSMLSVLCHRGSPGKQKEAICDLQSLLTYNDGTYISYGMKSIAWQILGLCQQIYGDLSAALISYQEALKYTERQINEIERATKARIQHVQHALEYYSLH